MTQRQSFLAQLKRAHRGQVRRVQETYLGSCIEVRRSVVDGSEITGAPGQPVDTGHLKKSWRDDFAGMTWQLATDTPYAPYIEDGATSRGPMTLRSKVGGFHSVKLTRAAWDRIVKYVARNTR